MPLLAQIDFADLPPREDFPARGRLQLFGTVDAKGHPEDLEAAGHRTLRRCPDPQGEAVPAPPPGPPEARSPLSPAPGGTEGFAPDCHRPCPGIHPSETAIADLSGRLPEGPETAARPDRLLEEDGADSPAHWVGGHPCSTQCDPRPGGRRSGSTGCCCIRIATATCAWGIAGGRT